ncbi:MAG: hypothetical protein AAF394_13440, partial [Planctomycetota bacterium]
GIGARVLAKGLSGQLSCLGLVPDHYSRSIKQVIAPKHRPSNRHDAMTARLCLKTSSGSRQDFRCTA